MNATKIVPIGSPMTEQELSDLFGGRTEVFGYKFARSNPNVPGNRTDFIRHEEGMWVRDNIFSGAGLFFFTDKKYLFPYMCYGDILVRIKIGKSDIPKMHLKFYKSIAIAEYSCDQYFVDKILPLSKMSTLVFIAKNTDPTFPSPASFPIFKSQSLGHLRRIGVNDDLIKNFKQMIDAKENI